MTQYARSYTRYRLVRGGEIMPSSLNLSNTPYLAIHHQLHHARLLGNPLPMLLPVALPQGD